MVYTQAWVLIVLATLSFAVATVGALLAWRIMRVRSDVWEDLNRRKKKGKKISDAEIAGMLKVNQNGSRR